MSESTQTLVTEDYAQWSGEVIASANRFLDAIFEFAVESGEHLTCGEIDALADLYRTCERSDEADEIVSPDNAHARHDDEGDDHYTGEGTDE